jgi:hypothetical protein
MALNKSPEQPREENNEYQRQETSDDTAHDDARV